MTVKDFINNDEKRTVILGDDSEYHSQRNNELDPMNTCATTSMVLALETIGYRFSEGKYRQDEDNLTYFMRNDSRVLDYYRQNFPRLYEDWKKNPTSKNVYQPNEVHKVLSYGTNLWMHDNVTEFKESMSIDDIVREILIRKRPVVISGLFGKLNHVVTLVGVIIRKEHSSRGNDRVRFEHCESMVIDDTYGYTENYSRKDINGNNVIMSTSDFIRKIKPIDSKHKMCHIFR